MSTMKIKVEAIRRLEDENGRVKAEDLVAAARDEAYPLHGDFPWNDAEAAHQRRLDIARQIISSVRTVVTTTTKKVSCVAYVRDPNAGPKEQGYVNVARLRTERDAALSALTAEIARVQTTLERTREIAAGLELEEDFREALAGAIDMSARMRRGLAVPPEQPGATLQ